MKANWMLLVKTEEKIWIMNIDIQSKIYEGYKHWCTLTKDTYGKMILGVYMVKIEKYHASA